MALLRRVFQVDKKCFIIFIDDFFGSKERFLRIGNSEFLNKIHKKLTFITLLTDAVKYDLDIEKTLINSNNYKMIIGLHHNISEYKDFLRLSKTSLNNLDFKIAEEKPNNLGDMRTEYEFLRFISSLNNEKLKQHSFASFYNDGNIRVFNKNELIFDLNKSVDDNILDSIELNKLLSLYKAHYENSYNKAGLIISGGSLFAFSDNNYICITESSDWIKDSIRVGIDPREIDSLFISGNVKPNNLWARLLFLRDSNLNIYYSNNNISLEDALPYSLYEAIQTEKNPKSITIDNIQINYSNKDVSIKIQGFKFNIALTSDLFKTGKVIKGEYKLYNKSKKFDLIIDSINKTNHTIYKYNPLILSDDLDRNDYIRSLWDFFQGSELKHFENNIYLSDEDYDLEYKLPFNSSDKFHNKFFAESVRRISIEANRKTSESTLDQYKKVLKGFTGEYINKNSILIEQLIGINNENIQIRDMLANKDIPNIDNNANPLLFFEDEMNTNSWLNMLKRYRDNNKKDISNNDVAKKIENRFSEIIKNKKSHLEEQERFKRFLNEIKIEYPKENKEISSETPDKTSQETEKKHGIQKKIKSKKRLLKINKKYTLAALIALCILLLLLFSFLYGPDVYEYFKGSTQIEYFKDFSNKYEYFDKKVIKKSHFYEFSMTNLDLLILTNIVAVKNGYHKIIYDLQKKDEIGKDPDWIFPGNVLKLPDATVRNVKKGDTMWDICETFLIKEINNDEIKIRKLIEQTKIKEIKVREAKKEFKMIKENTHSEMMRNFISTLIKQKNYKNWEPYIQDNEIKGFQKMK